MLWENRQSNYDKYPKIKIKEIDELSSEAYEGYTNIINVLNLCLKSFIITVSPQVIPPIPSSVTDSYNGIITFLYLS